MVGNGGAIVGASAVPASAVVEASAVEEASAVPASEGGGGVVMVEVIASSCSVVTGTVTFTDTFTTMVESEYDKPLVVAVANAPVAGAGTGNALPITEKVGVGTVPESTPLRAALTLAPRGLPSFIALGSSADPLIANAAASFSASP